MKSPLRAVVEVQVTDAAQSSAAERRVRTRGVRGDPLPRQRTGIPSRAFREVNAFGGADVGGFDEGWR